MIRTKRYFEGGTYLGSQTALGRPAGQLSSLVVDPRIALWAKISLLRLASAAVLTLGIVLLGDEVPHRRVALVVPPVAVVLTHLATRSRRDRRMPPLIYWCDAIGLALGAWLIPSIFGLAVVVLVSTMAVTGAMIDERTTIELGVITTLILVVGAAVQRPTHAPIFVLLYMLGCAGVVTSARHHGRSSRALRDDLNELLGSLNVAFWVADGHDEDPHTILGPLGDSTDLSNEYYMCQGSWANSLHADDHWLVEFARTELEAGRDHALVYRHRHRDGNYRWHEEFVTAIKDPDGNVIGSRGLRRDIDDAMQTRLLADQFADFVELLGHGVMLIKVEAADPEPTLRVIAVNAALGRLAHRDRGELLGLTLEESLEGGASHDERLRLAELVRTAATSGRQAHTRLRVLPIRPDFEVLDIDVIPLQGGTVAIVGQNITKRVRAQHELSRRATTDSLTGLANRVEFRERLTERVAAAGTAAVIALIDLDHFKHVNDSFGHQRGDELLVEVTSRLSSLLDDDTLFARLGGDEFAILLPVGATSADAVALAHRVGGALAEGVMLRDGVALHVGASIGIAALPDHAGSGDELLARADVAMYVAKRRGGGYAIYDQALDTSSARRVLLLGDLRRALAHGEIICYFQPIVDPNGVVVGAEALARWQHPDLGLLLPGEFIEVAEVTSLSEPLAYVVVRRAIEHAEMLRSLGRKISVSVNLTASNLTNAVFMAEFERMVVQADLEPGALTVEITERSFGNDLPALFDALERLVELGVTPSLDDFGAGQTSLAILRQLPVDELKIDRSLIDGIGMGDDIIVRALIEVSHRLNLRVVAEGIEVEADRLALIDAGCDRFQGYLIGHPMTASQFISTLHPEVINVET